MEHLAVRRESGDGATAGFSAKRNVQFLPFLFGDRGEEPTVRAGVFGDAGFVVFFGGLAVAGLSLLALFFNVSVWEGLMPIGIAAAIIGFILMILDGGR